MSPVSYKSDKSLKSSQSDNYNYIFILLYCFFQGSHNHLFLLLCTHHTAFPTQVQAQNCRQTMKPSGGIHANTNGFSVNGCLNVVPSDAKHPKQDMGPWP